LYNISKNDAITENELRIKLENNKLPWKVIKSTQKWPVGKDDTKLEPEFVYWFWYYIKAMSSVYDILERRQIVRTFMAASQRNGNQCPPD